MPRWGPAAVRAPPTGNLPRVSEQLLTILKFCLLAVVYLFFFRVLRAVWAEITPPKGGGARGDTPAKGRKGKAPKPTKAPRPARAPGAPVPAAAAAAAPVALAVKGQLLVVEPPEQRGRAYSLANELSIGRAPGCQLVIDDTYVSQVHARVYGREGNYVVEDLGSTNGTYLNRKKVAGPMTMQRGDRLQVGNTVLELE
jgi:hypothetical protein